MTTATAPYEPSAWLRRAMNRRVAELDSLPSAHRVTVIAPLGPPTRPGSREDRTCDRCRTYTPEGPPFYPSMLRARPGLLLVVGLCQACRDKELGP